MKWIQKIILAFMLGIVPIQSALADGIIERMVLAAFSGDLESLKPLVKICKGAVCLNKELFVTETYSITALMAASNKGYLEIVKYLIDEGAYVDAVNNNGATALMEASGEGRLEIVKYLISKNANINAKDYNGSTALIVATQKGKLEVVRYLISKGANLNAVMSVGDNNGVMHYLTALDMADLYKAKAIKGVLQKAGAKTAKYLEAKYPFSFPDLID